MWQKGLLLALALSFAAAANAHLCCTVSADGQELEGLYSTGAVFLGSRAATWAAEEIVRGEARCPELHRSYSLSFTPPEGRAAELSDALLRRSQGVTVSEGVYVDGERLGAVGSGEELKKRLESFIANQLPSWAVAGEISGRLALRTQYSRADSLTELDDMVLLISGAAPVIYSDGSGYTSWA